MLYEMSYWSAGAEPKQRGGLELAMNSEFVPKKKKERNTWDADKEGSVVEWGVRASLMLNLSFFSFYV